MKVAARQISNGTETGEDMRQRRTQMNATTSAPQDTAVARSEAMRETYEAYVERVYRLALFKVGNREDAEDIASQVFIKAAIWLDISEEPRKRLAWLYQVTRTLISDHWRHYFSSLTTSLDDMDEGAPELVADPVYLGGEPEDDLACDVERVECVLALLPENYRRVLELRFLHGYSLKDAAQELGTTEGNVRVLQHRALQKAAALVRTS
jgi:RNA polymerase sigma factor (sigma-70 family)